MNDAHPDRPEGPGPAARRLLYTDFDGNPCDPDTVINAGVDGGWADREPELTDLLHDESAPAYDRYLALSALAAWGSAVGYAEVTRAAADPTAVAWKDALPDRLFGADETFALLAEAVSGSADMADDRGTGAERLGALAGLVSLAADYYFDRYLSVQGLAAADITHLRTPLMRVIEQGLARLRANEPAGFDLGTQVAGLIVALGEVDSDRALSYAQALLDTDPDKRTVRELSELAGLDSGRGR